MDDWPLTYVRDHLFERSVVEDSRTILESALNCGIGIIEALHKQGVGFRSLTDAIDTGTPSDRFFFRIIGPLAEIECELTIEPTRAGRALPASSAAKAAASAR